MNKNITWQWSRLIDLKPTELYAVIAEREKVFCVEQNCVYIDCDGLDLHAWHLIAWLEDTTSREIAAYLRVVDPGFKYSEPSIGRVLTTTVARGRGLGKELTRRALESIRREFPGSAVRISAQSYLQKFYESFGFAACSEPHLEDNIPHLEMLWTGKYSNPKK